MTVKIDNSQFGWCKYNRSHTVKGQRAFGSVEHESRKTFLPFLDRTADTLMAVLREWTEPGITILKIYNTLVLPTFLYGSENWTALQRQRIGVAEMKLLRPLACYTLYGHKTKSPYAVNNRQCILDKIDEYRRNWVLHLQRMPLNRIPLKSHHCRPQGRRTIGRPKKLWRGETLETEQIKGSYS
jgi:hypothetical protein